MLKNILMHDIPRYFGIDYNVHDFSLTLSLHPLAERFFETILHSENPFLRELEEQYHLRAFSSPRTGTFGFGSCFLEHQQSDMQDWSLWICHIPQNASFNELQEIIASLRCITTIMNIFDVDICDTISHKSQIFCINELSIATSDLNSGNMSFSYSKHVLAYCKKLKKNARLKRHIIQIMQATYAHLHQQDDTSLAYFDFEISEGAVPHPYFKCPGNCACIKPYSMYPEDKNLGMQYISHNIDTKTQQITLLAGIISLAQFAKIAIEKQQLKQSEAHCHVAA